MDFKKSNFWLFLVMFFILAFIWGCADSSTTGTSKEIDTKISFNISNITGDVNITPGTDLAANAGATDQDTSNSATVSPKTTANAGWNGGSAAGQLDSAGAFVDLIGDYLKDFSRNDSDNIEERQTTVKGEEKIKEETVATNITEEEKDQQVTEFSDVESYDLKSTPDGSRYFQWMNHNGDYYGQNIKAVFDNGDAFVIKDGGVSSDQNGGGNMGLMWWFSGNDFTSGADEFNPSQYETGKGRASVFSGSGSSAKNVKIYFKRM